MSGGVAYVYDPDGDFEKRCNTAMVTLEPVIAGVEQENSVDRSSWHASRRGTDIATDEVILKGLIESHFRYTGSFRAREILTQWNRSRTQFVKVFPNEYRRALAEMYQARLDEAGPTLVNSDVDGDNPARGAAVWVEGKGHEASPGDKGDDGDKGGKAAEVALTGAARAPAAATAAVPAAKPVAGAGRAGGKDGARKGSRAGGGTAGKVAAQRQR